MCVGKWQNVREIPCGGVAKWGLCGVGELRSEGVGVRSSWGVEELLCVSCSVGDLRFQCMGVAV